MPLRWLCVGALMMMAACQPSPPAVVVLVVTATPTAEGTDAEGSENDMVVIGAAQTLTPTAAASATPDRLPVTPTHDPFPTPTSGQIQVAEQPFEHGRMFWVQPQKKIWVAVVTGEGRGTWAVYDDTFVEGEPEADPAIVPPEDGLYQPERGFGKLWRENSAVREALGWAVTPDEFGYISRYEYHPGGSINAQGAYVQGPGYHILFSLYEEAFRFNEINSTWQLGRGE